MKIKLFFILFLIVCTVACIDDTTISSGDGSNGGNDNEEPAEELTDTAGKLNIIFQNPGITTRSGWEYDDYFPSGDTWHDDTRGERWLYNLSVFYFDSDMLLEHFALPYINNVYQSQDGIDNHSISTNTTGEFTVVILGISKTPITTGAHYFYIVCNLTDNQLAKVNSLCDNQIGRLTKDTFEQTVFEGSVDDLDGLDGISQYRGTTEVDDKTIKKTRVIMTNITSPAPHYMADRSLASSGTGYPPANDVEIKVGFAVAKASLAYVPSGNTTGGHLEDVQYRLVNDPKQTYVLSNIFKEQLYTPHYDKNVTVVNFNQYFNRKSAIDADMSELEQETPLSNYYWRPATISTNTPDKAYVHCIENGNLTPLQENSTMLLVKAKYIPEVESWLNRDGTSGNKAMDDTFWRIWNNEKQIYLPGYYNEKPVVSGSNEAIEYKEGICYYPIWLETDGKFMVTRNTYYKIAITDVISAGVPSIDKVISPNTKLEDGTPYVQSRGGENRLPEATKGIIWETNN